MKEPSGGTAMHGPRYRVVRCHRAAADGGGPHIPAGPVILRTVPADAAAARNALTAHVSFAGWARRQLATHGHDDLIWTKTRLPGPQTPHVERVRVRASPTLTHRIRLLELPAVLQSTTCRVHRNITFR
jgi:hypothetical protein